MGKEQDNLNTAPAATLNGELTTGTSSDAASAPVFKQICAENVIAGFVQCH